MTRIFRSLLIIGAMAIASACTTLKTPTFADDAGAIRGYDPVAYHTEGKPVKGDSNIVYRFNDANWYFANEDNLAMFRQDPERYAPEYGGYCAYAMSKGLVVSTDPDAWKIHDGKLYLNYSLGVRKTWLKDIPGYVSKAEGHWQTKIGQPVFE